MCEPKVEKGWKSKVADLVGSSLLVGLGRSVVLLLLGLVGDGIASGGETARLSAIMLNGSREKGCLPVGDTDVGVLGDLLVGLLGSTVGGALDLVGDEVTGVLDGIHVD